MQEEKQQHSPNVRIYSMSSLVHQTVDVLDCYEGRDAAITFTLYFRCTFAAYSADFIRENRNFTELYNEFSSAWKIAVLFSVCTMT